jgi:hypothetical protein
MGLFDLGFIPPPSSCDTTLKKKADFQARAQDFIQPSGRYQVRLPDSQGFVGRVAR